jgi:hypothetical protein
MANTGHGVQILTELDQIGAEFNCKRPTTSVTEAKHEILAQLAITTQNTIFIQTLTSGDEHRARISAPKQLEPVG